MRVKRGHMLWCGAATAVAGLMLSPAIGAGGSLAVARNEAPVSLNALGSISSFTPTTKDPRLAAAYAKLALSASRKSFRFTPTSGSLSGQRSVTVMVRAGALDPVSVNRTLAPVDIAPVSFSLNVQRGWRKFALPESVGRKELPPVPVETLVEAKNFSLDQGRKDRFTTKMLIESQREPGAVLRGKSSEKDYTLGLASSYSLTRNLNVTAGVRYEGSAQARLTPMTDNRQDSQALYLGTVFKF
ncbi:hypothetical protein WG908_09655 [Sphingobium sp. AN641]|uniref:hypothetical protein n=1 Tax=Sphingobium sp. AN641 TaxID=3133443 RepID=UPI0030BF35CC